MSIPWYVIGAVFYYTSGNKKFTWDYVVFDNHIFLSRFKTPFTISKENYDMALEFIEREKDCIKKKQLIDIIGVGLIENKKILELDCIEIINKEGKVCFPLSLTELVEIINELSKNNDYSSIIEILIKFKFNFSCFEVIVERIYRYTSNGVRTEEIIELMRAGNRKKTFQDKRRLRNLDLPQELIKGEGDDDFPIRIGEFQYEIQELKKFFFKELNRQSEIIDSLVTQVQKLAQIMKQQCQLNNGELPNIINKISE